VKFAPARLWAARRKKKWDCSPFSLHRADCHNTGNDHSRHAQDNETAENRRNIQFKISEEVTHCSFLSGL
jgi:hypothetical protein